MNGGRVSKQDCEVPVVRRALADESEVDTAASANDQPRQRNRQRKSTRMADLSLPGGVPKRRKDELVYLRDKVVELEAKLEQLKHVLHSNRAATITREETLATNGREQVDKEAPATSQSGDNDGLPPPQMAKMWEEVATRQLERRQEIESENAKLRAALEVQIHMAKSLEKILTKRTNYEVMEALSFDPKRHKTHENPASLANDTALFEEFLGEMDAQYARLDEVFASRDMGSPDSIFRDSQVKFDPASGVYMEFLERKIVPFSFDVTCRAVWRFMGEKGVKPDPYYHENIELTEDTIKRSYGVELQEKGNKVALRGTQIMKKYMEENRFASVWKVLVEPVEYSKGPTKGMIFHEAGWGTIEPLPPTEGGGPRTSICLCNTMTPKVSEYALQQNWKIGALTDFVLSTRNQSIEASRQVFENLFMEENARQKEIDARNRIPSQ